MALFNFRNRQKRSTGQEETASEQSVSVFKMARGTDEVTQKELALRIATVYRCVDILSKGVAQLPLEIKRNMGGYYQTEADDIFGLNYLLNVRPNERMSAFELKRSMMLLTLIQGNAYLLPVMGSDSYASLILLGPNTVHYDPFTNTYSISDAINRVFGLYPADQIIHIKNMGVDGGYTGMSTLAFAGRVLAISDNADTANVETFKSGGILSGFVSGKGGTVGFGSVQNKQLESVAQNIETQLNSGKKIFNLPGEMSFNQISLSPKDIELLASKQFNVFEICRFFGVHPDKVFAQQTTNYKASEMSQVSFLTDTLQPLLTQIELEFETKIIPREMYGAYKVDFNIEPLMQTDLSTQADYMTKTIAAGARSVNDWRKIMGNAPVKGGDEVLVSANLLVLDSPKLKGTSGE